MTNIEKMLNAVLQLNGKALVLTEGEIPVAIIGDGERKLTKFPLGEREIGLLLSEWKTISAGGDLARVGSDSFRMSTEGGQIIFQHEISSEPVTQAVNIKRLLEFIVEKGASDLHLSSGWW